MANPKNAPLPPIIALIFPFLIKLTPAIVPINADRTEPISTGGIFTTPVVSMENMSNCSPAMLTITYSPNKKPMFEPI